MEMSQAVRILAALTQSETEGNNLLDAARALAAACADLMGAARPENLQVSLGWVEVVRLLTTGFFLLSRTGWTYWLQQEIWGPRGASSCC